VLVAESSAAPDARVYAGLYPGDVVGLAFVNGIDPDILNRRRPGGRRMARLPSIAGRSQDEVSLIFNLIGLYRLGLRDLPAPAHRAVMMLSEWKTIRHLTRSSKAHSARLQEIASRPTSTAEARAGETLGDRPLFVLVGRTLPESLNTPVWAGPEADLSRLSARRTLGIIDERPEDLIYRSPRAIIEVTRQVIDAVQRPGGPRKRLPRAGAKR
jgi:hypothetical protein